MQNVGFSVVWFVKCGHKYWKHSYDIEKSIFGTFLLWSSILEEPGLRDPELIQATEVGLNCVSQFELRDAFKKKIAEKETLVHSHLTPSLPSLNGTREMGT